VIHSAPIEPDGFANLRFAALATCRLNAAFPAAPPGDQTTNRAISAPLPLATEAADLAVHAFPGAACAGAQSLVSAIEQHAARLEQVAADRAAHLGLGFNGIDFSLAPFPRREASLGEALQRLGAPARGGHGSLAAAALVAEAVDRARFARVGFSGLMLPVLEDAVLAQQAEAGSLSVKDLLLYSAVCGTGLDTVPLPGDVSVEALAALLLDVGVLSCRLNKPLTRSDAGARKQVAIHRI
jgi:uncharacterized protein (UPF0210 family)